SEKVTRLLSHIGGMIKRLERARIPGNSIHHPHGRPVMSGALGTAAAENVPFRVKDAVAGKTR
ncbi:hypothetical protein, partial [Paenarthrobacter sp. PH39-S1]|uniref:hypothetical protein n=1 Tax=Paenarthrobacter sp. PH39-S1 TaxID=3046204 RepID=UPI0024BA54CE